MSYDRDKSVTDVMCVPEVSPDLLNWYFGPAYTTNRPPENLGNLERLTSYDLAVAAGVSQRFMRLRFWRPSLPL
jgi:hypothetical protein